MRLENTDNLFEDTENADISSADPKVWDEIQDLDMTHIGYFDLPEEYLKFREELPSKTEKTFFINGMFITAKPGEMPADTYLKYEEKEKTDPISNYWRKNKEKSVFYKIHRNDWSPKIQPGNSKDLISSVVNEIVPIFLTKLQPKAIKSKHLSKQDLYSAYKEAICNSKEIENRISFDEFISNINFTIGIANWVYAPKISPALQNDQLKRELKNRFYKKLLTARNEQSKKWYKKYFEYQNKIKNAKDIYNITFSSFFQDLDGWKSVDQPEKFKVKKEDLFNPFSNFYINNLIKAKMNKDLANQIFSIHESIQISDLKDNYQIVFGYKYDKEKGAWILPDNKPYSKHESVYSVEDLGFVYTAKWQERLKKQYMSSNKQNKR